MIREPKPLPSRDRQGAGAPVLMSLCLEPSASAFVSAKGEECAGPEAVTEPRPSGSRSASTNVVAFRAVGQNVCEREGRRGGCERHPPPNRASPARALGFWRW